MREQRKEYLKLVNKVLRKGLVANVNPLTHWLRTMLIITISMFIGVAVQTSSGGGMGLFLLSISSLLAVHFVVCYLRIVSKEISLVIQSRKLNQVELQRKIVSLRNVLNKES